MLFRYQILHCQPASAHDWAPVCSLHAALLLSGAFFGACVKSYAVGSHCSMGHMHAMNTCWQAIYIILGYKCCLCFSNSPVTFNVMVGQFLFIYPATVPITGSVQPVCPILGGNVCPARAQRAGFVLSILAQIDGILPPKIPPRKSPPR